MYLSVRWLLTAKVAKISASEVPTVPVLLYDVLMPLYGSPMLSMMLEISPGGSCRRIDRSTRSQSRAVSSIRVAVGARKWRLNEPLSTLGKKSCPNQGTINPNDPRHAAKK